ncbi:CAP domain-containing protein [Qipengyuania algicida]|nr:CAP domain-containing protein [Qipengyuania algicida]
MRAAKQLFVAGCAVALSAMPLGRGTSEAVASAGTRSGHIDPVSASELLDIHNRERARLGLVPLQWSPQLARQAGEWAIKLARTSGLAHSTGGSGMGENLWIGTRGTWTPDQMLGFFLAERSKFRDARFPHVSRTGNWADVGHYTQIVWHDTREVGCAIATANQVDVLVCRYYPAGNVVGQSPY